MGVPTAYVCATRRTRGDEGCTNKYGVLAPALTEAVLARLTHIFSDPLTLGDLLRDELERRREAPRLDTELSRLADAVAGGDAPQTLLDARRARESERREVAAKLEHVEGLAVEATEDFDLATWMEQTRELLAEPRTTFKASPAAGRGILRSLLTSPITITPEVEDGRLSFRFSGSCYYDTLDQTLLTTQGKWAVRTVSEDVTGAVARPLPVATSRVEW